MGNRLLRDAIRNGLRKGGLAGASLLAPALATSALAQDAAQEIGRAHV